MTALVMMGMGTATHSLTWAADSMGPTLQPTDGPTDSLESLSADGCNDHPIPSTVALFDVIERALCVNPKTRSAWAAIRVALARVDLSKSAYWPSLAANASYLYQHNVTQADHEPELASDYTQEVHQETLSLGWVLYDFGSRSGSLHNSRELLVAARASKDGTLQSVFTETAKHYFAAQAADATVSSKSVLEASARETLEAATVRVDKGVAPVTDQLQAKTALAQASYERVKAEGDARAAMGSLAIDMNLSPDEVLTLPEMDKVAQPDVNFAQGVHALLEQAQSTNPQILAAAAELQAALANVRVARAHGMPVLQAIGESTRSNQPVSASLGQPALPAQTRENYIGIEIKIPLFDGFSRRHEIREAQAQADLQQQGLRDTERQVAAQVWSSVQTLQTDTENLRNTDTVWQSAQEAFIASQHRYRSGVGSILELLAARGSLAAAEQQRIVAREEWRVARLRLAESLGTLGMWAVN